MPWKETCVTDQRLRFVGACQDRAETMTDLCLRFGISRRIGYKWLERYTTEQLDGLKDRSRVPHTHPNATPADIEDQIVAFRLDHWRWGPKKIVHRLSELYPRIDWPAASTAGDLLKRYGLVTPRRKRRRTPPYTRPFAACLHPNIVWCADLKGWFLTGDGRRCDPFTLTDACSRFLLRCQVIPRPNRHWIQAICDAAFREYGLPDAIRTDNGPPFAAASLGGLSRLAIHWIKLGITPERIDPGHPEQNGRHERMHRTLGEHTASPPQANARHQQRAFDLFRDEYNYERPHEALGQCTPASVYQGSPRPFPRHIPEVAYPDGYHVRRVRHHGQIKWHGHMLYLSEPLTGEPIGLYQYDDEKWNLYFGPIYLATWNQRRQQLEPPPRRSTKTAGNE
jgi:putative transposase